MTPLEIALADIDAVARSLDRRSFLKSVGAAALLPRGPLDTDDERFFRRVAATLIPPPAFEATGIDVVANLNHLLTRTRADHRKRIASLIRGSRRISFLYGGEHIAIRARRSRFVVIQKVARALSAVCLLTFWGDTRAMALLDDPKGEQ